MGNPATKLKPYISLVEKGRAKPSLETLLLAERLQQPVAYFLEQGSALGAKALRVTLASGWTTLQPGDYTRAAAIFQDALPLAQAQGDERALAECHIGLGSALATLRQVDVAREHIDRGAALAEASGAAPLLVRVSYIRGLICGGLCWCRSTGRSDPAPLVAPYQDSPRSAGSASRSHRLA